MTLDACIEEVNANGYWVGSLHQHPGGDWTARTVRYTPAGAEYSQEFAHGATAEKALRLCWEEAKRNDPVLAPPKAQRNYHLEHRAKKEKLSDTSIDDLLKDL